MIPLSVDDGTNIKDLSPRLPVPKHTSAKLIGSRLQKFIDMAEKPNDVSDEVFGTAKPKKKNKPVMPIATESQIGTLSNAARITALQNKHLQQTLVTVGFSGGMPKISIGKKADDPRLAKYKKALKAYRDYEVLVYGEYGDDGKFYTASEVEQAAMRDEASRLYDVFHEEWKKVMPIINIQNTDNTGETFG